MTINSGKRLRAVVLALVIACVLPFAAPNPEPALAADTTPKSGGWQWCTDSIVNGCIEAVTTTSPTGVSEQYTDSRSLPSGLTVSATCSMNSGAGTSCNGNKYVVGDDGVCRQRADWTGGFTVPSVEMDIRWPGKSGWSVMLRLSTGDYLPAFLIGHGTTKTETTNDGDGTYTFEFTSMMEFAYSGNFGPAVPGGTMGGGETVATSASEWVHVQLWPRDHLINQQSTPGPCKYHPFMGSWAEANAQGFSWSYMAGAPIIGGTGTADVPNTLKFIAYAPHYKPQDGTKPLEVIDARVQVFLPTDYFRTLGYATLDEFDASSYAVSTADGQSTTPTTTKRDDGLLINLGIRHYSAPNPTVTFAVKGPALATTGTMRSTTPIVRRPTSPTSPTASTGTKVSMKKAASKSLSSIIRSSTSGKKSWKVTGGCSIRGTKLVAPRKKATCRLTLTVRNSKGKTVSTKKATVVVG